MYSCCLVLFVFIVFFKQKTAYEMRISDWSSDVCSSDLSPRRPLVIEENAVGCVKSVGLPIVHGDPIGVELGRRIGTAGIKRCGLALRRLLDLAVEIGRASCRERVCQYV